MKIYPIYKLIESLASFCLESRIVFLIRKIVSLTEDSALKEQFISKAGPSLNSGPCLDSFFNSGQCLNQWTLP